MTKKGLIRDIGAALTVVVLVTSVACGAPPQKPTGEFEVVSLDAAPSEVSIGEEVKITAKIVNIGEAQGTYTAVLMINDVELERKDVVIPAQDSAIMTFSVVKNEAGTYRLAIDDVTASLSVSDPMQAIRSAWESFQPLADMGLVMLELNSNYYASLTGHITSAQYEELRAPALVTIDSHLVKVGNQELRELWIATTQRPAPPNSAKLTADFIDLYLDSVEAAMDGLRSSLDTEQKSVVPQELRAAWESLEPLTQIALLIAENIRNLSLLGAGEINQSEFATRSTKVGEKIDASLDTLGNKELTKKLTTLWFKPSGAEKAKLQLEFFALYQSLFRKAMEDFSQKLSQ